MPFDFTVSDGCRPGDAFGAAPNRLPANDAAGSSSNCDRRSANARLADSGVR